MSAFDILRRYPTSTKPYFHDPRPLVLTQSNAVVSWSAKSASAQVMAWYLVLEGLSDEALSFDFWPHRYRECILYQKKAFREALTQLIRNKRQGWTLIRVMRTPLNRMISSYRHALLVGYLDNSMSKTLGRQISHTEGFSIANFLEFLRSVDIMKCDLHIRAQVNPIDKLSFKKKFVINADQENLFERLNTVESHLGLAKTQFEKFELFSKIEQIHHSHQTAKVCSEKLFTKIFTNNDTKKDWPGKELRELPEVQNAAKEIYAIDYEFLNDFIPPH